MTESFSLFPNFSEILKHSSSHPRKKRFVKLLAAALALFALSLLLAIFFHVALLRCGAQLWIVDSSAVEKVDAVIIPGGGMETRPFGAAEWYHAGKSKRLATFRVEVSPLEELGITKPQSELTLDILKELKVPGETIEVIGEAVTSTQDEVMASRGWAEKNGIKSVAIMTEIFPSRRVDWAYRKGFKGSGVEIHIVALRPWQYTAENWWLNEQGLIDFQNEIIKFTYYLLKY